jgi:hypothetical protein
VLGFREARLFVERHASEFGSNDFGRFVPDAGKDPLDPACHRPELVEGGDVFLLQRLPSTPQQTQSLNRTWNGLIQRHRAGLPAWQFNDEAARSRRQLSLRARLNGLPPECRSVMKKWASRDRWTGQEEFVSITTERDGKRLPSGHGSILANADEVETITTRSVRRGAYEPSLKLNVHLLVARAGGKRHWPKGEK